MAEKISEIVHVAEVGKALYLLIVEYEEGDGGNGVGHVFRTDGSRDAVSETVLSTNDTLRSMWASPGGYLWMSSEDGNVWTNAPVRWSKPRDQDAGFIAHDPSLKWTLTTLPELKDEGYAPTLGAIWGTGDDDVFTAASGGHIYHWDGKAWSQVHTAAGTVRAFSGTGPSDVFAVGEDSALVHFDGRAWRALRNPDDAKGDELFTGVRHGPDGAVYICSQDGRLLHGSASGLTVLAQDEDLPLMGLAFLGERLLFAAGAEGVAELQDGSIDVIRSTFHAVSVTSGKKRLYFLDASTETCYIEYDPANKKAPWVFISL